MPSNKCRKNYVIKRSPFGNDQKEGKWKLLYTTGWNLLLSAVLESKITVFSGHTSYGSAIPLQDVNSYKGTKGSCISM